jgi:hypothetical protein
MKISPAEAELFHEERKIVRQTDRQMGRLHIQIYERGSGVDEGLLTCKSRGSHYSIGFTVCLDVTTYNLVQITNILKERATFIF